jgi:Prp8 binding protein
MDDECVVSSDADGIVRVWDAETGGQVKSYASTRGKCANATSAARGDLVMSVSDDGKACVWDLRVKKRAARTYTHAVPQTACAMSVRGDRAYVGGVDDVVRAWDARMDDKPLMTLKGHEDTITGLDVSPCGSYVLSNSMDNTLRMWDTRAFVEGERETKQFVGLSHNFEKGLLRCAFNADGTRVGAGSADSCVYVWDVENAKLKYKLPGHKGVVTSVAFSPTENPVVASGGADGVIFVGELDR